MNSTNAPKKTALVIGINFYPELTGIGKYTAEMVDWLIDNDFECSIVTSFPYYPYWKVQAPYKNRFYKRETSREGKLHVYRCPLFVPKQPSGVKRLLQEASFFFTAFFMMFYLLFRPKREYIFCMAPPFHLGFLALFYRFFKGGKIVYHVQDLQIEAARDLQMIKGKWAFNFLFFLERIIMSKVNFVSTISAGMVRKISSKINKNVLLFPNWVDTNLYHPVFEHNEIKSQWNFEPTDKIVLYSGSIGEKQGLDGILHVAKKLEDVPFIKFVICGTGPYKEKLIAQANEANLNNVYFFPLQTQANFNHFLNMADLHLIIQKKSASDLVMPSKLTTILAVGGLALVTAEPDTNLYNVIKDNKMGVVVPSEDTEKLTDAVLDCCMNDYSVIRNNGRIYAEQFLNKNNIIKTILSELEVKQKVEHQYIQRLSFKRV